jgi:hypothetical protein
MSHPLTFEIARFEIYELLHYYRREKNREKNNKAKNETPETLISNYPSK